MKRIPLKQVLSLLQKQFGAPPRPVPRTPFEWVLWENVAYLVHDDRRLAAWRELERRVGLDARSIDAAPKERLLPAAKLGGMHPETRVERWKVIAALALESGDGTLVALLDLAPARALKELRRFPSIGAPGAEKIRMACGRGEALALESNGLRALLRLGFGREGASYAASYRSVTEALADELPASAAERLAAHQLLRTLGQSLCTRSAPDCDACPLARRCPSASG